MKPGERPKNENRLALAFMESYNSIPLAGLFVLAMATWNFGILLVGAVVETVYLLFVPDSKWFLGRLDLKYDQEVTDRREKLKKQIFPTLNPAIQTRFGRLELERQQISSQTFEGKKWFREVMRKLDYLLEKFLLFASKQVQFESYLRSVLEEVGAGPIAPPMGGRRPTNRAMPSDDVDESWVHATVATIQARYDQEIQQINATVQKDENLHNQAVLDKRREVLMRRQQYVVQIGEILSNLTHQLDLMEDTFGLINDEIRARSPEQVLADIDDVVSQTDSLTETLQEVSPFEQVTVGAG